MNRTASDAAVPVELSSVRTVKATATALVSVASIVGNLMVVFVVWHMPQLHTNTYYLIVNLSISDLLLIAVAMPSLVWATLGLDFPLPGGAFGHFVCKTLTFATFALIAASVLTMAVIALDRYFAIVLPLKRVIRGAVFRGLLTAVWLVAFLTSSPFLLTMRLAELPSGTLHCEEDWGPLTEGAELYTIILFVIIFAIPFAAMAGLYTFICYYLWFRKVPGIPSSNNQRKATISSRKATKMLITVLVVFLFCYLPLQVASLLIYFQGVDLSLNGYFACHVLLFTNGAINPMLYAIYNERFRIGFKAVLTRMCGKRNQVRRQSFLLSRAASNSASIRSSSAKRRETLVWKVFLQDPGTIINRNFPSTHLSLVVDPGKKKHILGFASWLFSLWCYIWRKL